MAKAKAKRTYHRLRKAAHRVRTAKPSIALLGGLAFGPAEVILGGNPRYGSDSGNPIWKSSNPNKMQALWDRLALEYVGGGTANTGPMLASVPRGSAAIGIGALGHWLGNISGINRYLARMKMPFRI